MLVRMAAGLTAGLAGLAGSAALACAPGGGPCVYTPASPAYAVAPQADGAYDLQRGEGSGFGRGWRDGRRAPDRYGATSEEGRPDRPLQREDEGYREHAWGYAGEHAPAYHWHEKGEHRNRDGRDYDRRFSGPGYAGRVWGYSYREEQTTGRARGAYAFNYGGVSPCGVCAPPPPAPPPPPAYQAQDSESEGAEAPEMSDSFFYGGLSGGAGPGLEIGGPAGSGYGNEWGASGFGAAQAWGEGMANAYASAHASASAFAFASGGVHGCPSCWVHPKPPPHKPGCGCKHR